MILIAEDHADTGAAYTQFLSLLGFESEIVGDGQLALLRIERARPDLVVMDMGLPLVDGWEVTRRLRADAATADLPIIAVTGHVYPEDRRRAKDLACDGFLAKPFALEELASEIQRVVATRLASAQLRAQSVERRQEQQRLLLRLHAISRRLEARTAELLVRRQQLAETFETLQRLRRGNTSD